MNFIFDGISLLLLFFGAVTLVLSLFVYNRVGSSLRWFSLMMLANAVWSIAYGFELASSDLRQITFFINIEYLGITTLPLFWFLFCLNYSGKECWYKKPRNIIAVTVIPILTIAMVWTNPLHHLYYKQLVLNYQYGFISAEITRGIWYYIFTAYFYLLLICGCFIIIKKFKAADPIYKRQNYSILIAAIIPWIGNITYLLGFKPFGYLDVTPFSFTATTLFILIGIYRFKLFDIIPIAREKVLELMQDGFIVLDNKFRVIDFNKSITNYIAVKNGRTLFGSSLRDIFPFQLELIERIAQKNPGKIELTIIGQQEDRYLEADVYFLDEGKIREEFTIIKFQDFTKAKKEALLNKHQAVELEKLNQLKDRIFSIIAHDLRGPLVNLSEVMKLLTSQQLSFDDFSTISPVLSRDIVYTTDLLENILHWSRSQLKGFGIKKEYFGIRNVILNEINYHIASAQAKHININHDVFPFEMVYADVLMFQIVIRNILNNAIKFCNQHCEINITASYQDGMMQICIKDDGIGIPSSIISKLFKEENITTRGTANEKGTGLGLLVCKDFMKRNDGDITVESKEGHGTKFCIMLPTTDLNEKKSQTIETF